MRKAILLGATACGMLFAGPALSADMACEWPLEMTLVDEEGFPASTSQPMQLCAEDFDENGDDMLDANEWSTAMGSWHGQFDADQDTNVTIEEIVDRLEPARVE